MIRSIVGGTLLLSNALTAFSASPAILIQQKLDSIKNNPTALTQFLKAMPKGGDLHMHESGSSMSENMLTYALDDHLCINRQTYTVFQDLKCPAADELQNAIADQAFRDNVIDAWSMRHFDRKGLESGHDHFFNTFGKYSAITSAHRGEILAEMTARAENQHVSYLEIMLTPDRNKARDLGKRVGFNPDFALMRQNMLSAGMPEIIFDIAKSLDEDEHQMQSLLTCQTSTPKTGCHVSVRYLYQVAREQSPEMVFAQLLAGFEAAMADTRIVGINLVQPEDGKISMRDYKLHMRMVEFLHQLYPAVHISLHAGELNESLTDKEGLSFHIHDAVKVAGAGRIGHGVDITQETNAASLLKDMANDQIMVEINLSSNDYILNMKGKDHPLHAYLKAGVPVALSTDDEGVSREDLTMQFQRAVTDNDMSYPLLKTMIRNSLFFAFVSGENLWQNTDYQKHNPACEKDSPEVNTLSDQCRSFLQNSQKATLQWQLEKQLHTFENEQASTLESPGSR